MNKNYKCILSTAIPFFLSVLSAGAQAPGGVSTGLQLWLPAENYTGAATWVDASGNGRNAAKTGTIANTTLYNYNPVPTGFSNANYFSVPHNTALNTNNGAISVFAVGLPGTNTYSAFIAKTNAATWDAGWVLATSSPSTDAGFTTGDWAGTGTTNVAKQSGFSTTIPYIISGFGNGAATNVVSISNNGNTESTNTSTKTTSNTRLTIGYDGYGNGPFNGNIGEVIMYNAALTAADKLKVQSYLAVKYGITLNLATNLNYVNSQGTPIWTPASHSGYNTNIFGIARDDNSSLYQKQSKSTTDGSITAYLGTLTTANADNTGTLSDLDAVLFGDNNLTGNTAYNYPGGTAFANGNLGIATDVRSSKIWNVQVTNTNTAGGSYTINIATPGYANAYYVLVSPTSTFNPPDTRIYTVAGGAATGVLVNDGDYVAIGSNTTALPLTLLNFEAYKKGSTAELKWTTTSEKNCKGFAIERSKDGQSWMQIGFVPSQSAGGSSTIKLDYYFTDHAPAEGQNFYRLKQLDFDEQFDYSGVRGILFGSNADIILYPNPAKDNVSIDGLKGGENIYLYDAAGRLLQKVQADHSTLNISLNNLSSGIYNMNIIGIGGTVSSYKLVKE